MESVSIERGFHSPRSLAKHLNVSTQTIYEAIWSGSLKAIRLGERRWLIDPDDASRWLSSAGKPNVEPEVQQ